MEKMIFFILQSEISDTKGEARFVKRVKRKCSSDRFSRNRFAILHKNRGGTQYPYVSGLCNIYISLGVG